VAAIALLLGAHESPTVISDLVLKLRTDFNYIFPRRLNNANVSQPKTPEAELTNDLLIEQCSHRFTKS